jgi:hypothetical protein
LMGVQFWPQVGISICNATATYDKLEHALQKQYFQILPLGGVIRTAPLDCWMVDAGFYCPGLPHPGVGALIAMTNKLLMHFGCRTALGNLLRTSYSLLLLELGVSFKPLQSLYQKFSFLATHAWMKMFWEKLDKFNITVQTAESPLKFPRQGDKFLMLVCMECDHGREALIRLNRVRVHLQLIFLSDILSALGLRINPMVLQHQATGEFHLSMRCPKEEPTDLDFLLWRESVEDICPSRLQVHSAGMYVEETHRIHPWRWCQKSNTLLHTAQGSDTMDVYSNTVRKLNRYANTASRPQQEMGKICSVEEIQPGMFRVMSTARMLEEEVPSSSALGP